MTPAPTHAWLILNGKSAGDDGVRAAVAELRHAGATLQVRVTWETGDANRYVDEAIQAGADIVIAAGGDGTLSEVATALAHRDADADALPSLGVLPLGTANDFATAAGIPADAAAALRLPFDVAARPIDLLRVSADGTVHWVANVASGGFGTEVTVNTGESLKSMLGGLAYVVYGLGQLGRIEPQQARIAGPGFEWNGEFIALGIGNGRQAGGGQALCPDAIVDDGLLDVTIVPPLQGELAATLATAMLEGRAAALERVAVRTRLPWVEVATPGRSTLNLDGEPVEASRFRIECIPGRVRIHLPADCPLVANPDKVAP